jgi:hypothetical protein
MPWIHLMVAGAFEVFWAISLKYTDGFSKLWPSLLTAIGMIASFYFLAQALKTIPWARGTASGPGSAPPARQSSALCCFPNRRHGRGLPASRSSSPASWA